MLRTLALLRHGLASGQSAGADLLPEGAAYLRRLGSRLEAEGWRPEAILTSPYLRARASASVLARALGCDVPLVALDELVPEGEVGAALAAIGLAAPRATPVLVVAHLPLVGHLAHELIGEYPGFSPGTLVEIARDGDGTARLLRRIGPQDMAAK